VYDLIAHKTLFASADEERKTAAEVVKRVRQSLRVPLTVGGGISSLSDAHALLMAGADKISGTPHY
jgi:cyclase